MRYKFYREHKYISFRLSELERLIAKTDFEDPNQVQKVQKEFSSLCDLLKGHASYEDEKLHSLLKKKGSFLYKEVEKDHGHQDKALQSLQEQLDSLYDGDKIEKGYQFYLHYRKFVAENLLHLHEEETLILPELQRLYSDKELQEVEFQTYKILSEEDMTHMLQELFPVMNKSDKKAFLKDIEEIEPKKLNTIYSKIKSLL